MADSAVPHHIPGPRISPLDTAKAPDFLNANNMLTHTPDPIFVSDLEGRILHANDAAWQLLGVRSNEALEGSLLHFLSEEEARAFTAALCEAAERGEDCNIALHLRSASGEVIPATLNASALRGSDDTVIGAVGILRDMRAYERATLELDQAKVDLETRQLNCEAQEQQSAQIEQIVQERTRALMKIIRAKDEFMSIASHELKTPLTTMKLLMQLAQREQARANAPTSTHVERMGRAIARMEQLINDLLDVSRIDSGNLIMRPEPCNVAALCQQVAEEQAAASSRVITFVAQGTPVEMYVDGERVGQVVTNLLSNALKYSPTDAPVAVTFVQQEAAGIICVRDKGSGIPAEALPHIFERFYRVPGIEAQNGAGGGLGLGLHLCHELVERHGGQIWAESAPGSGSNFYVALPVAGPLSQNGPCAADEAIGNEAHQPLSQQRAES